MPTSPPHFGPLRGKSKLRPDQTTQPSTAGAAGSAAGSQHRRCAGQPVPTAGVGDCDAPPGIKLFLFTFRLFILCILNVIEIDIANLAPPKIQPPANGSSRASGGILRNKALGNVFNFGDEQPVDDHVQAEGYVNLSIVSEPPKSLVVEDGTSIIKVLTPCHSTMGPLLERVARAYSPLRSKLFTKSN